MTSFHKCGSRADIGRFDKRVFDFLTGLSQLIMFNIFKTGLFL